MKLIAILAFTLIITVNYSYSQVGKSHYKAIKSTEKSVDSCRCYIYDADLNRYLYKIDHWDNYIWGDDVEKALLFTAKQAEDYAIYFIKKDKKIWIGVKYKK
jgi:hypothetical protein